MSKLKSERGQDGMVRRRILGSFEMSADTIVITEVFLHTFAKAKPWACDVVALRMFVELGVIIRSHHGDSHQ